MSCGCDWLRASVICVAATFLLAVGCGEKGPEMVPVTGTVTYKGEPLRTGTIQFHPTSGRQASGKIVDGQIVEVSTFNPGDGALVGKHQVTIYSFVRPQVGFDIPPSVIPERYNNPSTSALVVSLESGSDVELNLELND